jgi:excisionase family DNA binding protein
MTTSQSQNLDVPPRPTLSVEEAGALLGISRGAAYEGVRAGEIPSIRIGRRIVVPTAAVRRMLQLDGDGAPRPA